MCANTLGNKALSDSDIYIYIFMSLLHLMFTSAKNFMLFILIANSGKLSAPLLQ